MENLYYYAVIWGYAFDKQQTPTLVILPTAGSFEVMRLEDGKTLEVCVNNQSPIKQLAGIYFFDAWRLHPQMAADIAPTARPFQEPMPNLQAEGDGRGAKLQRAQALDKERRQQQYLDLQDEED